MFHTVNTALSLGHSFVTVYVYIIFGAIGAARLKFILPILGLISAILAAFNHQYPALFLLLPLLVISFGSASTPFIRQAGRFGDLSYGLYIYAFPVQQTVIMLAGHRLSVWGTLLISTLITGVLALLSWHFVERPTLRLKHYLKKKDDSDSYVKAVNQPI